MSASLYFSNHHKNTTYVHDGVAYNCPERVKPEDELNMANGNARHFLSALGLDPDFEEAPQIQVREFEAACRRYLSSELGALIDQGTPTVESRGGVVEGIDCGKALVIHCGRREGYLEEKVALALRLCADAIPKGATHVYFC